MTFVLRRLLRASCGGAPLAVLAGLACNGDRFVPPPAKGFSAAFHPAGIAQIDNDLNNIFPSGPGVGSGRPYSGEGVHSPN
jgi:hypothetical protein